MEKEQLLSPEYWDELLQACHPVDDFLVFKTFGNRKDSSTYSFHANDSVKSDRLDEENDVCFVPSSLIERWGSAMGILLPVDPYSFLCFLCHIYIFLSARQLLLSYILKRSQILFILIQSVAVVLQKAITDM